MRAPIIDRDQTLLGRPILWWVIGAMGLTFLLFVPVIGHGWTNWDDPAYILNNPHIRELDWPSLLRLFDPDHRVFDTYTPLTQVTFALEYQLAGRNASLYHLNNLLLHVVNTGLVFMLARSLQLPAWVALFTTLVFGIHPMHVESVAWITERKDLLFSFFYLVSTLSYLAYRKGAAETNAFYRQPLYWLSVTCFAASLFAKPQAVTLPALLVLCDLWLGRKWHRGAFLDKVAFVLLAGMFTALSLVWKHAPETAIELAQRLNLSGQALVLYLGKFFYPWPSSAVHPFSHFEGPPWSSWFGGLFLLLLGVLVISLWKIKRWPFLMFGLLFFLIHIFPTLHLFKVNSSLIYERFTYLSYVGLAMAVGYAMYQVAHRFFSRPETVLLGTLILLVTVMVPLTGSGVKHWKNAEALWTNVIAHYPDDHFAYGSRANHYQSEERWDDALIDYDRCLAIHPTFVPGS